MRFLDKNQFAGKEIFEFDLVGGMANKMVGSLFMGKFDIQAETFVFTRPFIGGLHYSTPCTGNNHKAIFSEAF